MQTSFDCRLFSDLNPVLNTNLRSYFDRWREAPDLSGQTYSPLFMKPSWRLRERPADGGPKWPRSSVNRSLTDKVVREVQGIVKQSNLNKIPWDFNHHVMFSRGNHEVRSNFREYFDCRKVKVY